jgi:DNA-binding CsgD family transcriptional regulator
MSPVHRFVPTTTGKRLALLQRMESLKLLLPEAILPLMNTPGAFALAFGKYYQRDVLQIEQAWDFLVDVLDECWHARRYAEVVQLVDVLAESAGRRPQLVDGMAVLRQGVVASRRCADHEHEAAFLNRLGGLLVACGKYAIGWRIWHAGHRRALVYGSASVLWQPLTSFVHCIDLLVSRTQAHQFVTTVEMLDDVESHAVALLGRGLFARFMGDMDDAIQDFTAIMHLFFKHQIPDVPAYQLFRAVIQAELARAQDQWARSQMWTCTALHLAEVFSDRYTVATLLIDQGSFLVQQSRVSDVHTMYVRLIALVEEMRLPHMLERCRFFERYLVAHGAFATATVVTSVAPVHDQETLSSRENEVLKLVAQGYSNKEIAAILVISGATVKKHLEHIYMHLGVHNRTAAVARVNALQLDR